MGKCWSDEIYRQEIKKRGLQVEPLENYSRSGIPILHRCLRCGYEWKIKPGHIIRGHGCPKCAGALKKTKESYIEEIRVKNPLVELVGDYINARTKTLHRCRVCGKEWLAAPDTIIHGHGCPSCNNSPYSIEEIKNIFESNNPTIQIVKTNGFVCGKKIIRCKICGNIWDKNISSINKRIYCPYCPKNNGRSTWVSKEEFLKRLCKVNPYIELISEYTRMSNKMIYRCLKCGYEWEARGDHILEGHGCPNCFSSIGEEKIKHYLINKGIKFEVQKIFKDCRNKNPLKYDFYLPEYNVCIEYDGEQHFKSVKYFGGDEAFAIRKENDKIKTDYCLENNIFLLRIRYNENIEQTLDLFFLNFNIKELPPKEIE